METNDDFGQWWAKTSPPDFREKEPVIPRPGVIARGGGNRNRRNRNKKKKPYS